MDRQEIIEEDMVDERNSTNPQIHNILIIYVWCSDDNESLCLYGCNNTFHFYFRGEVSLQHHINVEDCRSRAILR